MLKIRENLKTDSTTKNRLVLLKEKKVHLDFKQMNNGLNS